MFALDTLAKAMELELGGEIRQAVVHMIGMKMKPYEAMAKLIRRPVQVWVRMSYS